MASVAAAAGAVRAATTGGRLTAVRASVAFESTKAAKPSKAVEIAKLTVCVAKSTIVSPIDAMGVSDGDVP